jgi:hypothetical protein
MKNQPVFVHIGNNPALSKFIQEQCFAAGCEWITSGAITLDLKTDIRLEGKIMFCDSYESNRNSSCKELSVPEFLAHLETLKTVKVKLNDKYTAEIKEGKVVVGCQTIEFAPILELAEKIREVQGK